MKCGSCGSEIFVTHSYPVGGDKRVARGVCMGCKMTYRLMTFMEPIERRGQGARATAGKLERGDVKPRLVAAEEERRKPPEEEDH